MSYFQRSGNVFPQLRITLLTTSQESRHSNSKCISKPSMTTSEQVPWGFVRDIPTFSQYLFFDPEPHPPSITLFPPTPLSPFLPQSPSIPLANRIHPSHPSRILQTLRHRIDGFPCYPLLPWLIRPLLNPHACASRIACHGCFAGAFALGVAGSVGGAFAVFCEEGDELDKKCELGWDGCKDGCGEGSNVCGGTHSGLPASGIWRMRLGRRGSCSL